MGNDCSFCDLEIKDEKPIKRDRYFEEVLKYFQMTNICDHCYMSLFNFFQSNKKEFIKKLIGRSEEFSHPEKMQELRNQFWVTEDVLGNSVESYMRNLEYYIIYLESCYMLGVKADKWG